MELDDSELPFCQTFNGVITKSIQIPQETFGGNSDTSCASTPCEERSFCEANNVDEKLLTPETHVKEICANNTSLVLFTDSIIQQASSVINVSDNQRGRKVDNLFRQDVC